MNFSRVCLESIGFCLPGDVVTSEDIEERLIPLYERLRLPAGRLALITGIRERRFWPAGMLPSEKSVESGELAISAAGLDRSQMGCLIHASVCRDHLEPATACRVHHELGLPANCLVYDVSNACLGLLNGAIQIAQLIELGEIQAGLVVGTEGSRQLVETTIDALNGDLSLTRSSIKSAIASLTIGSGSCALLLTSQAISQTGNRLVAAVARAETSHHRLCHSGADEAVASGMQPLMETDSETLMRAGVEAGVAAFDELLSATEWRREDVTKTICHQVGTAHRRMMLEALDVPLERDFATVEWLGNTGSVVLPITLGIAAQQGHLRGGDHVGLLGIGSGINSIMLGVDWQRSLVESHDPRAVRDSLPEQVARKTSTAVPPMLG